MTIARSIEGSLKKASWIRRMFEAGRTLKAKLGEEAVFDFSLGNPVLEPPPAFQQALQDLAMNPPAGLHRYMPNSGHPSTRAAVARMVSEEQQVEVAPEDVIMTVGAAGAINATLHSLLDPGDEVIVLSPYFVEYLFYVANHGGAPRIVETDEAFEPDLAAIDAAITGHTKALIINTPNNPTGRIYSEQLMSDLAALLARQEKKHGREIYLLVDTPYAKITYDGNKNPRLFSDHPSTVINHSHSKDLGLAGERIGYIIVSPRAPHREALRNACTFSNRVLGFINAPSIMQLAMERSLGAVVDTSPYVKARQILTDGLRDIGYEFIVPEGAFYLFPRSPIPDDVAFAAMLREDSVLVVPGRGFGRGGYIRIAYCVPPDTVERALPHFEKALKRARG
jgi:aspartate aminotransferase